MQCCGSGCFIPDPNFFHPGFRIRIKEFKYFGPKNGFKALGSMIAVVHLACRILTLYPSWIPGSKRHLDPRSATLPPSSYRRSLQPPQRPRTSKNEFFNFLFFVGHLGLPVPHTDLDPQTQLNPVPYWIRNIDCSHCFIFNRAEECYRDKNTARKIDTK